MYFLCYGKNYVYGIIKICPLFLFASFCSNVEFSVTVYLRLIFLFQLTFNVAKKGNGDYKDNFYFDRFDKMCTFGYSVLPQTMREIGRFLKKRDPFCPLPAVSTQNLSCFIHLVAYTPDVPA